VVTGVAEQELDAAPRETQLADAPQMVAELVLQAPATDAVVVPATTVGWQVLDDGPREAHEALGPQIIPALVWQALD